MTGSRAPFFGYFTDNFVCRTAGLPQYGQLGHGTDNEVKPELLYLSIIILFLLLTVDTDKYCQLSVQF